MLQSFRWFGPHDPVMLREVRQAGVTDIVSSLHHLPCGSQWPEAEIEKRIREVEWDAARNRKSGLRWSVVESLPIHEDIKTRSGNYREYIEIYKENILRLGKHGLHIICYNFIPVLDWARTDLNIEQGDGSFVSGCNMDAFVAFDLFILQRENAAKDYSKEAIAAAESYFSQLDSAARRLLQDNILLGLPGTVDDLTPELMLGMLQRYRGVSEQQLRQNLHDFLNDIMPTCEAAGVYMSIHPDDPAYVLFGVPRVMCQSRDVEKLFAAVPSQHSGLTMCTGSFGSCIDNNAAQMLERFAHRVYFVHFRNVMMAPEKTGSFCESNHLYGAVDMPRAMKALIQEEEHRRVAGWKNWQIHMRPDHGKLMEGDIKSGSYPGYSRTGRMIGLAELRGLECGLRYSLGLNVVPG